MIERVWRVSCDGCGVIEEMNQNTQAKVTLEAQQKEWEISLPTPPEKQVQTFCRRCVKDGVPGRIAERRTRIGSRR